MPKAQRMIGPAEAYPFPTFTAPVRLIIALAMIVGVFLLNQYAGTLLDNGAHFLLMGVLVIATAWFAGTGAALGTTIIAAVLGAFRVTTGDEAGFTHLALFIVNALLATAVVAELRHARRNAEARAGEAQAAREQADAANRLKDEFLATISHELRTPLNAVLGWVHLLRTGKLDSETAERGLASIDRNVRLQSQLTADLLDVSKALTGKLRVSSRPTALDDGVRQALTTAELAAEAKGVRVEAALAEGVIVQGDPARLRQIAWHLLTNAIKFSARGGVVEVVVDVFGQDARLIVRDNGPGIDPQFLPRVFERFTQADGSPTRKAGGLGVGLALVRELVELHGGEIEARNREDRSGSIFMVRFPLKSVERSKPIPVDATAVEGNGNRPFLEGLRVLVLDQEGEARELLRTVLQQRGAAVQAVGSVADALQYLETWRPDVLVSDSLSPERDSYALIGKVHSLDAERGGRIPAVALTTVARTDERLGSLLSAVQSDVPKPVEPSVLTSEIARLAGRERRHARR